MSNQTNDAGAGFPCQRCRRREARTGTTFCAECAQLMGCGR